MENTSMVQGMVEQAKEQLAKLHKRIDAVNLEREAALKNFDTRISAIGAEGTQLLAMLHALGHKDITLPGITKTGARRPMTPEARQKISDALRASAARKKQAAAAPQAPEKQPPAAAAGAGPKKSRGGK